MPIPLAQILSAAAPLVMNAVDLYRRRNDATAGAAGAGAAGDSLQQRLRGLEESDLEQSRLIAELSRNLEALARAHMATIEENRRNLAKIQRLLWTAVGLAAASITLAVWVLVRS